MIVYCAVSYLFFGLRLSLEPGRQYIGVLDDPQIPIWSFAWWPHAVAHGENPFVTHAVWAPHGVNLAWANTLPPLALLFWPLTSLAGPVAAYNVVAVLLPAISAWTAFLLCRHLTRGFWPSLVGGYLFGFSSYMLGHLAGQPQLTAVFLVPLVALLVLRYFESDLGGRGLTLWLGLTLGLQLYLSLEVGFSLTFALVVALLLAYALVPTARSRLVALLRPLTAAYALATLIAAPILYFALSDLRKTGFTRPGDYVADLLNLVVPTHVEASGAGWAHAVARHFPGNDTERGVFLGLPVLLMLGLFFWERRRSPAARFLFGCFAVALYASLGSTLTVAGHGVLPLPTPFGHDSVELPGLGRKFLPLFDNTLPVRFAVYSSLAAAVAVALWLASRPRGDLLRWLLVPLGVLLLAPNPSIWTTTYTIPRFFTDARYRPCLGAGANVLPEPVGGGGQSMLWQVADDFRFRMAGGRLQTSPPSAPSPPPPISSFPPRRHPTRPTPPVVTGGGGGKPAPDDARDPGVGGAGAPGVFAVVARAGGGFPLLGRSTGPAGLPGRLAPCRSRTA